jgi:tetratricopeptide (TPR) repeat protein
MLFFTNIFNTMVITLGLLIGEVAFDSRTVSLQSVSVPGSVASQGYSADVAQQRITSAALAVVRDARTYSVAQHVQSANSQGPVELIATYLGMKPLLEATQQAVGGLEYRVAADIVTERSQLVLRMRATRFDGRVTTARVSSPPDQIEQLLADGGFMLLRLVDPQVACSAVLRRSASLGSADWAGTARCIEESLDAAGREDKMWLYNLLGVARVLGGDGAGALSAFRSALEIEPDFSPALLNLGILLATSNRHEDALRAYRTVFRRRSTADSPQTYAATRTMMAMSLERLGREAEALVQLRRAIRAAPHYTLPQLLLLARVPEGSAEAEELRRMIAQAGGRNAEHPRMQIYTDNLLGMMSLGALLN